MTTINPNGQPNIDPQKGDIESKKNPPLSLNSLPPEILNHIVSFLPPDARKNDSNVNRALRNTVVETERHNLIASNTIILKEVVELLETNTKKLKKTIRRKKVMKRN